MFKATSIIIGLLGCVTVVQAAAATKITGNAARGESVYVKCVGCHSPERNRTGPKHCGLIGRKAGTVDDFSYTQALQQSDIVWSEKTLNQFLSGPLIFIPGTAMAIAGISSEVDRRDLISYLASLDSDARCQ